MGPAPAPDRTLVGILLGLTFVTGLVDAFSFLLLGRVFVANMTGNVVFLAFALAGAADFEAWPSLVALAAFAIGAFSADALPLDTAISRSRSWRRWRRSRRCSLQAPGRSASRSARPSPLVGSS